MLFLVFVFTSFTSQLEEDLISSSTNDQFLINIIMSEISLDKVDNKNLFIMDFTKSQTAIEKSDSRVFLLWS